jgi:RNA polymerase sigma-70 factor (ECF subfamily)
VRDTKLRKELSLGSPKAYRILYDKYYDWLCNYIFKLTLDKDLAKDLVQDVFVRLWERKESLIITTSLKSYLFKACYREFLMYQRNSKTIAPISFVDQTRIAIVQETYEEKIALKNQKVSKLYALIDKLPPKCRQIFVLSKIDKLKYKEIAEDLNISVKTVEAQMSKALHFIRNNASIVLSLFLIRF